MGIGARRCRSCIAGPTITACRARPRISCRRTSRAHRRCQGQPMGSILVFLTALLIIATWWLSKQGLMSKPWLEQGVPVDWIAARPAPSSAAKVGLGVFLAVVGSLFALFIS